jgi:hypothetical protein
VFITNYGSESFLLIKELKKCIEKNHACINPVRKSKGPKIFRLGAGAGADSDLRLRGAGANRNNRNMVPQRC